PVWEVVVDDDLADITGKPRVPHPRLGCECAWGFGFRHSALTQYRELAANEQASSWRRCTPGARQRSAIPASCRRRRVTSSGSGGSPAPGTVPPNLLFGHGAGRAVGNWLGPGRSSPVAWCLGADA